MSTSNESDGAGPQDRDSSDRRTGDADTDIAADHDDDLDDHDSEGDDDSDDSESGEDVAENSESGEDVAENSDEGEDVAGSTRDDTPEKPLFLRHFPDDADLNQLVLAFTAGNYDRIRRGAPELARKTQNPEVARAALELVERITPDPLIRYLFFASVALLVVLTLFAYGHSH